MYMQYTKALAVSLNFKFRRALLARHVSLSVLPKHAELVNKRFPRKDGDHSEVTQKRLIDVA